MFWQKYVHIPLDKMATFTSLNLCPLILDLRLLKNEFLLHPLELQTYLTW